jgi:hypothetical protein
MSGRGGRGGRGRGGRGGGGGGPQSISQQYLASTAREAGLDIRAISGRNGNDVIFPDMELHSGENNGRNGNATTAANSESNNGHNGNVASGAGGGAIRVKQESSSDIGSNGNNTSSELNNQLPMEIATKSSILRRFWRTCSFLLEQLLLLQEQRRPLVSTSDNSNETTPLHRTHTRHGHATRVGSQWCQTWSCIRSRIHQ